MASFEYQPLNQSISQIRLVTLLPAREPAEPPELELSLISLQDESHVAYFPVSYTWGTPCHGFPAEWGDSNKKYPLSLNGGRFEVHANLYSFLMHIRGVKRTDEPLWIDAVCINQEDVVERNSQVQLMRLIYQQGYCTIIWLGPEAQQSTSVLEKMIEIDDTSKKRHDDDLTLYSETADQERSLAAIEAEIGSDPEVWVAICRVFDRTWWQRAWVVQEAIVSTRTVLLCGAMAASFPIAMGTFGLIQELYEMNAPVTATMRKTLGDTMQWLSNIEIFRSLWEGKWRVSKPEEDLLEILANVRKQAAKDPRDMIYAGLGLSSEGSMVTPDYSASVQDVYASFARKYIEEHHSLVILAECSPSEKGVVSWAPDWSEEYHNRRLPKESHFPGRNQVVYNASKDTKVQATFSTDSKVLTLRGRKVDLLLKVGEAAPTNRNLDLLTILRHNQDTRPSKEEDRVRMFHAKEVWTDMINQYNKWIYGGADCEHPIRLQQPSSIQSIAGGGEHDAESLTAIRYRRSNESIMTAFDITLRADLKTGVKKTPGDPGRDIFSWESVVARNSSIIVPSGPDIKDPRIQWDAEEPPPLPSIAHGRKFFISKTGYIGLAPRGAQEGDLICVFLGSEVPHIIRPKDNGHHLLVGEAYVHGIMDGQVFESCGTSKVEGEEIVLD